MKRLLWAAMLLPPLAACGDLSGPPCAEGHYETRTVWVPNNSTVEFGVNTGGGMKMVFRREFVCDRYVQERDLR